MNAPSRAGLHSGWGTVRRRCWAGSRGRGLSGNHRLRTGATPAAPDLDCRLDGLVSNS